jgi:hypothetical protein
MKILGHPEFCQCNSCQSPPPSGGFTLGVEKFELDKPVTCYYPFPHKKDCKCLRCSGTDFSNYKVTVG